MHAPDLYRQLQPFARLANKHALSVSYRALVLSPGRVRGCAPYGAMSTEVDLPLDREGVVDAADFLQTLRSLPAAEFIAQIDDQALRWVCGPARGHLNLLSDARHAIEVPIPWFDGNLLPDEYVDDEFPIGLELGSLGCAMTVAARAFGLQGVQIHNRDGRAWAYSSDDLVLACCGLGKAIAADGEVITLHPDAALLLAELVGRERYALVATDAESVYCGTAVTELLINRMAPLNADLAAVLANYGTAKACLPLWRDAVAAFLRRAGALAEAGQKSAPVEIAARQGRVTLKFTEAAASTEEFYEIAGGADVSAPPVRFEAGRLAKAINHAEEIVFDYAAKHAIVLRGEHGFQFGIWGRED